MSGEQISSLAETKEYSAAYVAQSFRSKTDFCNYFKTCLQLYTPEKDQLTKEWIRMILAGEKKLLPLKDTKPINVGNYQEISVKGLYEDFANRPLLKPYMPPKINQGRQCMKEFFFTLVNSFYGEELQSMMEHAHSLRHSIQEQKEKQDSILVCASFAEELFKFPYQSRAKGRTVHLLKQRAKRIRVVKERTTHPVLASEKRRGAFNIGERRRHEGSGNVDMQDAQFQPRKNVSSAPQDKKEEKKK